MLDGGKTIALGARAFDLLLTLIEHRDRLVGKDELMALVWPGTVVEESNLTVQISALRKLLGAKAISTVSGRGYRFTLVPDAPESRLPEHAGSTVVDLTLPDRPSIAVLPFTNMSRDADQEYFTDGITEDIITELSRFRELFVIARNSSFTYKGKAVDVRAVGKELGVRYVVEGSIRRGGSRVRVTAQLIDALNGTHLWAERYDRVLTDIFAVQEEITRATVTAIAPQIGMAELAKMRRRRPDSLSAYELAARARAALDEAYRSADRGLRERAILEAREALAIEPDNLIALTALATGQHQEVYFRTAPDLAQAWREGMDATVRAIAIDPSWSRAYARRGLFLLYANEQAIRWDEALGNLRHAHDLNPNDIQTLTSLGFGETVAGDPRRALDYFDQALRISPRDPWAFNLLHLKSVAHFLAREYALSVEAALAARNAASSFAQAEVSVSIAYVGLGELVPAREAIERARTLAPEFVQSRLDGNYPFPFRKDEDRRRAQIFLCIAAGLEDPSAAASLR